MTVDPRQLGKARDEARAALTDLCDTPKRAIMREIFDTDTGRVLGYSGVTHHTASSLLDQLREQVANSGGRTGGLRRAAPIPIAVDALDLWSQISAGSRELAKRAGAHSDGASPDQAIRSTVAAVCLTTDLESLWAVRDTLHTWAKAIRALLDPQKRVPLWGQSCPVEECLADEAWREDESDGEVKRTAALEVVFEEDHCGDLVVTLAHCLACGAEWSRSHLYFLAQLLGRDVSGVEEGNPAA